MHRPWHTIGILAFTQITSWGSLYYAFSILAPSIGHDLALRQELVYGAFSWSLLVPALARTSASCSNREGLGIEVDFSLPSERVIRSLDRIIEWRGKPLVIRCDNGPEYISAVTLAWAAKRDIRIDFIQPGQPQQNAYVERYNRTVRYDWLAHHLFDTLEEIQDFATRWLWTYNHDRPNMALGGITPKQKLALAA